MTEFAGIGPVRHTAVAPPSLEPSAERIFSVQELSRILNVREETIRKWIKSGRLKGVRVGPKLWRIAEQDLIEFLRGRAAL